jgi:hypothetical protein
VTSDITKSGGPEKGITNSMDEDIGIGMAGSPFIVWDPYPAKPKITVDLQPVCIKSETNAGHS